MQPVELSHEDFPHSTATTPGMRIVEAERGRLNVFVHLDVPFAVKSGRTLHLQIIQPSRDATFAAPADVFSARFPCIVFVQGSAWGEQALGASLAFWCRFAERGYTIAIVEYRPSSLAIFPAQVQDAKTAVRWLRARAETYSIDPDRIVMAGDSSGGHTALMVHATQHFDEFDDEPGQPLDLRAVIDFYAPTDLARLNDEPSTMDHTAADSPEGRLLGGISPLAAPELVAHANPSSWISPDRPLVPLLVIHGSKDRLIPFAQSVYHVEALRAAGQPVELVQVRDADHGIWPAMFNDRVADIVDDFIRRHTSPVAAGVEASAILAMADARPPTVVTGPLAGRGSAVRAILTRLPEWFADPAAVEQYVAVAEQGLCWLAGSSDEPDGFVALARHFPDSAEVVAVGVLPESHRRGIGRALIERVISWASTQGIRALFVRTLGPSDPDPGYASTRAFYQSVGFIPLEETTAYWGQDAPCLLSVRPLPPT